MVFQFPKELNTHKSIERHEEQEEQSDIVDLLTRTPMTKDTLVNVFQETEIENT